MLNFQRGFFLFVPLCHHFFYYFFLSPSIERNHIFLLDALAPFLIQGSSIHEAFITTELLFLSVSSRILMRYFCYLDFESVVSIHNTAITITHYYTLSLTSNSPYCIIIALLFLHLFMHYHHNQHTESARFSPTVLHLSFPFCNHFYLYFLLDS